MTNYDGTGPRGRGPFTGRGMGFCIMPEEDYNKLKERHPKEYTESYDEYSRGFGRRRRYRFRGGRR
jgi:hypothetical protein